MRKQIQILTLSIASWLLTGCVTVPMDVTTSGRDTILPADLKVKEVRPTIKLATAEEELKQMGNTFRVNTGKIYRQVFIGADDSTATIDLVNSSFAQSMNDVMLLATKTNVTYSASVVLTIGDHKHVLNTTQTASTAWTIDRAAREAVERAVIDLAKQAQVYLATR